MEEITACVDSLDSSLVVLKLQAEDAALAEEQAVAAVARAALPRLAPFLAARNDLQRRREDVLRHLQHAEYAIKLQSGLEKRAALVERHEMQIAHLREERAQMGDAAQDRDLVIGRISGRYGVLVRRVGAAVAVPEAQPADGRYEPDSPRARRLLPRGIIRRPNTPAPGLATGRLRGGHRNLGRPP
ncbi:hypothetical protein [Streptomyces sp. NPDC085540]|uniref:hypothetical protein n=1 Tax=Streptomyces sp. NPDC085540 TaxID=3365730 RepID=UPI0037D376AD